MREISALMSLIYKPCHKLQSQSGHDYTNICFRNKSGEETINLGPNDQSIISLMKSLVKDLVIHMYLHCNQNEGAIIIIETRPVTGTG